MSEARVDLEAIRRRAEGLTASDRRYVPELAADVLALCAEVERLSNLVCVAGGEITTALKERDAARAERDDVRQALAVQQGDYYANEQDAKKAREERDAALLKARILEDGIAEAKSEIERLTSPTEDGLCAVCGRDPSPDSRRERD